MIDNEKRLAKQAQKDKVRKRMQVSIDAENYEYIPAKQRVDYYSNDVRQRVGIYVRVSTDDVRQITSYELQKKYYEEFVRAHPNWELINIYPDEGMTASAGFRRSGFAMPSCSMLIRPYKLPGL